MFTQTFTETLLADPELADAVWQRWFEGWIDGDLALIAWLIVASCEALIRLYKSLHWQDKVFHNNTSFTYRGSKSLHESKFMQLL